MGVLNLKEIEIVGYIPGAIGKITELHAKYYNKHAQFGLFFEVKVASEMAEFLSRFNQKYDGFWVAKTKEEIIGSITVDSIETDSKGAHLRWFIVSSEYHGQGIGNKLLQNAIHFLKEKKIQHAYLWTFAGLDAARHLYEKFGFKLTQEQEGDQWGVIVREQKFELILEDKS